MTRSAPFVVVLAVVALSADSAGVSQEAAAPPARPTALSRAWAAIAGQKYDAADQLVDRLLVQNPMDHAALLVRLAARSGAGRTPAALDAYERWLNRSRTEDVFLLEPIAVATLTGLAASPDPGIASMGMARLARYHPETVRLLLQRTKLSSPALDAVAAALGDAGARTRLADAMSSPVPRVKLLALTQIASGQVTRIDSRALVPLLSDPAPPVRAEAARALAAAGGVAVADNVRPLLQDPDGYVRASAAVALGHLGDTEGLQALEQMLASPVGDTALMAAEVLKTRGVDVSAAADRALQDENPLTRLSAIAFIQGADPTRAAGLLREAARDPNPVIRSRAAELLEQLAVEDIALLRSLLGDDSPEVRTCAASALLRLAMR